MAHPCSVWQSWRRRRQPELNTERKPQGDREGARNPEARGQRGQNMPDWHVCLGEGAALAFRLLGSLPQKRAQLCVLSNLWENLALHLPAHLSVGLPVLPVWEVCVRCEDVHPVAVVPRTASSPGRKQ